MDENSEFLVVSLLLLSVFLQSLILFSLGIDYGGLFSTILISISIISFVFVVLCALRRVKN